MGSEFSVEDGFDELYFALGAQSEEERDYVEQRFDEFYRDHVGYEIVDRLDEDFFKDESSEEQFLEGIAEPIASGLAKGLAESLKLEENVLEGFYSMDIEERFDYLVFMAENYSIDAAPNLTFEERVEKFGSW